MGLAVAKALSARNDWDIHILDINSERGAQTAQDLARTTFHRADVTKYSELSEAFQKAFAEQGRLDFVFANAGVIERFNFYAEHPAADKAAVGPPPEPDLVSIDADLKGVILTTYLAQHYFRHSPHKGNGASIVMTASCCALYPSFYSPLYSAAKCIPSLSYPHHRYIYHLANTRIAGVVGFMRSIAKHFIVGGVRVNAIAPGIVRTNLVDQSGWDSFPQNRFIEVDTIARTVLQLVEGGEPAGQGMTDVPGRYVPASKMYGLTVELSDSGVYFRDRHEYCDDGMREVMDATVLENQVGAIIINN